MTKCALCGKHRDLRKSHLIPKSAYRVLGKSKRQLKSPILVRSQLNRAGASDFQYTKNLLCDECEQLFSDKEDLVSRYWYRRPGFLLRNKLRHLEPDDFDEGRRFYSPYPAVGLDEDDFYYFALSLAWRACQGSWGDYKGLDVLTPNLEREISEYLLGRGVAPPNVKVMVYVDWDGRMEEILTLPHVDQGRIQIVLLGLCIEVHVDVSGSDKIVKALTDLDEKISLVLDKTRWAEFHGLVLKEAVRLKSLGKRAWPA